MSDIIIIFHTESNTGYAMSPLERTFFQMATAIAQDENRIHFGFKSFKNGSPKSLPANFANLIPVDREDPATLDAAGQYIREKNIIYAFCFDLQVNSNIGNMLRKNGVRKIISYWGAAMSAENSGLKLAAKRLEVFFRRGKPDHFIFESEAMRHFAVNGRGLPKQSTSVIPTGVDIDRYHPNNTQKTLLAELFPIPENANVVFYSGHMERRKGVHVIIDAAIELVDKLKQKNIYFLIAGNKYDEEKIFLNQLDGHQAKSYVIFAGYRTDLNKIMPCCDIGVIASTGWDSFPMSSIEMAACGLPLVVSDLQGLRETIEDGKTGIKFPPGQHIALANVILDLLSDKKRLKEFSTAARQRIEAGYSTKHQLTNLISCCQKIFN